MTQIHIFTNDPVAVTTSAAPIITEKTSADY